MTLQSESFTVPAESEDSVGANEEDVLVTGYWLPPEPEVGVNSWGFEITDIRNNDGISVLELIEDEDWLISIQDYIAYNYRNRHNTL